MDSSYNDINNLDKKTESLANSILSLAQGMHKRQGLSSSLPLYQQPHAIALQECTEPMIQALTNKLNEKIAHVNKPNQAQFQYRHACHKLDNNKNTKDGVGIIFLTTPADVIEDTRTLYVDTEKNQSQQMKKRATLITQIRYGHLRGNLVARLATLHLDGNPYKPNLGGNQLDQSLAFIDNPGLASRTNTQLREPHIYILGGDFNRPPSQTTQALNAKGYISNPTNFPTERFHGAKTIDYTAYKESRNTPFEAANLENMDQVGGAEASDHLPILLPLRISPKPQDDQKHALQAAVRPMTANATAVSTPTANRLQTVVANKSESLSMKQILAVALIGLIAGSVLTSQFSRIL